ncbi:MAG TPA: aldehyde dehydrogenase family protein [Trebonia sp.]|nr:aldehyde dehydrogenase family protein [Trebonia sp.]
MGAGTAFLGHDDAQGLVDHGPGGQCPTANLARAEGARGRRAQIQCPVVPSADSGTDSGDRMPHDRAWATVRQHRHLVQELLRPWSRQQQVLQFSDTCRDIAAAQIASIAGRHLKKQVLELGGSDAFIVLDDANVAAAAREAVRARMLNAGQSCVAAKRFIVQDSIAEEFARLLTEGVRGLVMGDPWDRHTDVGPLAREDLAQALVGQVDASIAAGARPLVGGGPREGAHYPPTVLADVTPDMPVFTEEIFGPVAALVSARG